MTTLTTKDTQYRNEIIEMARQANFYHSEYAKSYAANIEDIEAFAKLVDAKATAREREACAAICDEETNQQSIGGNSWWATTNCAEAIRARGGEAT